MPPILIYFHPLFLLDRLRRYALSWIPVCSWIYMNECRDLKFRSYRKRAPVHEPRLLFHKRSACPDGSSIRSFEYGARKLDAWLVSAFAPSRRNWAPNKVKSGNPCFYCRCPKPHWSQKRSLHPIRTWLHLQLEAFQNFNGCVLLLRNRWSSILYLSHIAHHCTASVCIYNSPPLGVGGIEWCYRK